MDKLLAGLMSLIFLSACGDSAESTETETETEVEPTTETETETETEPETETEVAVPERSPIRTLMLEHFTKARDARNALIAGDGDAAREAIGWLAENDPSTGELADELRAKLDVMREQAGTFSDASGLAEAGQAYASILVRCGECHTATEGGPTFATPPVPEGDGVQARMQLHRWAAERMFEGLVVADAEHFKAGARALETDPLRAEDLPQGDPVQIQAFADHVHTLGEEALAAESEEDRAGVYGRFIATCAACHRALGMSDVVAAAVNR